MLEAVLDFLGTREINRGKLYKFKNPFRAFLLLVHNARYTWLEK